MFWDQCRLSMMSWKQMLILGITIDTNLKYDADFTKVLQGMRYSAMRLSKLTSANELPWFHFIRLLQTNVLTKAFYHCFHICVQERWETAVDDILLGAIHTALNTPKWRQGLRSLSTLFGQWRWSTQLKEEIVRRRASYDLMPDRSTADMWRESHHIKGTLASASACLVRNLAIPSLDEWAEMNMMSPDSLESKVMKKRYVQACKPYLQRHETVWKTSNYPTGSLNDIWTSDCPLLIQHEMHCLSWTCQFAVKDWLRLKMGYCRPVTQGRCTLCHDNATNTWDHLLNKCDATRDLLKELKISGRQLELEDITETSATVNLEARVIAGATLMRLLDRSARQKRHNL